MQYFYGGYKLIYKNIKEGKFIDRPNRFIANIEIDGKSEVCHVKNTGRCKELLLPGATVFVQEFNSSSRKTRFDLIGVVKGKRHINIDSQVPNKVFHEWLQKGFLFEDIITIKPEVKYKNSRFDFYVETEKDKIFIEVKGVTLEENNIALFPDAPTERGVKHINELVECIEEGYKAYIVFVIQIKNVAVFSPNGKTHKEFEDALKYAYDKGVNILAYDCEVSHNTIEISEKVEVKI
ncbi:MAG: sugar fermentation stimulation protein [Clostridiales bacterium]|jgi:sugar fermentation stimulation protein A|nr:sugar fermentation stimulation protein [Clostridiales bacterium]